MNTPAQGLLGPGIRVSQPPPLSLYVHIPWCVRKCPYCDFNSHELRGELPEARYIDALVADLEAALPWVWGRRVRSVFLGGGTPSLLSEAGLDTCLTALRTRLPWEPGAEVTLEANPGTFESARFAAYRDAGVNRLSVGIQSFNDRHLQALGRIHDAAAAHRAAAIAARHFANFNLDLMFGLPGQTPDEALADVHAALSHGPTHLSCYQLTLEPNTPFYHRPPALPEHDLVAGMEEAIAGLLDESGFGHYETSAYATPGFRCAHNLNYWTFGDYLGIGAGAHSKLTLQDRIVRQMRHRHPEAYMKGALQGNAVQESHDVALADLPFEFMMNAMRLCEGVPLSLYEQRTGLSLATVLAALERLEALGLVARDWQTLRPTLRGQRFLNELLQHFLPE
ncbi:MAG: oxygen-independent coproporphyrinogen III oxidase-like protein [Betaproteobacteria bacterium]|nr:oxygen-independent coproporphyrinogen III oxidase-like protein [Betaproteobacteria bacterium]